MKTHLILLTCAWCAAASAYAQSAPSIPIEAQPLTHQRDGRIQGCGVRLTGGEPGSGVSAWFDVSFNLFTRGFGVAQSIAYEIRPSDTGTSVPVLVPVQSTWLRASEGSTRRGENTERRDRLVFTLLAEDVLLLFEALANDQLLSVGVRRWGERVDSVYTAIPVLAGDSRSRISACLAGLDLE